MEPIHLLSVCSISETVDKWLCYNVIHIYFFNQSFARLCNVVYHLGAQFWYIDILGYE